MPAVMTWTGDARAPASPGGKCEKGESAKERQSARAKAPRAVVPTVVTLLVAGAEAGKIGAKEPSEAAGGGGGGVSDCRSSYASSERPALRSNAARATPASYSARARSRAAVA